MVETVTLGRLVPRGATKTTLLSYKEPLDSRLFLNKVKKQVQNGPNLTIIDHIWSLSGHINGQK